MPRALHLAILRNAALLVPVRERAEWFAEWASELWYVDRGATSFCLGSFRDALWLRRDQADSTRRRTLSLDSPLRCVLLLVVAAGLSFLWAFGVPSRKLFVSLAGAQFAAGCLWTYLLALLILLTLNPLALGHYPADRNAPSRTIRLRRWAFLAAKIALLVPTPFLACVALQRQFPPAPFVLLFGWILGFRWALADQKQRCPVCLHLVSNPVRVGSPVQMLLGCYGTELICTRGHGSLFVPGAPTSWCANQRRHYLDSSWGVLGR